MSKNIYLGWGTAFILMLFLAHLYTENGASWMSFMLYLLASTSFIALPHEPVVLYFGKQYGVLLPLFFSVIPTILGCYLDYLVLAPILRHRAFTRIRTNRFSQKIIRFFRINPFVTIFIAALSPFPFYPVRILSIGSEYSANKYVFAVLLGRLPRFFILATGGYYFGLSNTVLIVLFCVLLILFLLSGFNKINTRNSKFILS